MSEPQVVVSRGRGQCLAHCSKTGIYKVGDVFSCRSHIRQVLDEALLPKDSKEQDEDE